jgi:hypothetical protein
MTVQPKRKLYPEKLRLNNENKDDQHFHKRCKCHNCNEDFWWIKVPKGRLVKEFEKELTCPNCEVKGKCSIW